VRSDSKPRLGDLDRQHQTDTILQLVGDEPVLRVCCYRPANEELVAGRLV